MKITPNVELSTLFNKIIENESIFDTGLREEKLRAWNELWTFFRVIFIEVIDIIIYKAASIIWRWITIMFVKKGKVGIYGRVWEI